MEERHEWIEQNGTILCLWRGTQVFADTLDHWNTAIRRLLGLDDAAARAWVEAVNLHAVETRNTPFPCIEDEEKVTVLVEASHSFFGAVKLGSALAGTVAPGTLTGGSGPGGMTADMVFEPGVGVYNDCAVVGNRAQLHGWLVNVATPGRIVSNTIEYETSYYEGDAKNLGYDGGYLSQEPWRMEKARRLLRHVMAIAQLTNVPLAAAPRVLDAGAGYGYFRKAADEAGWHHEGVEVSVHAARVAESLFGFSTKLGGILDLDPASTGTYDVITAFDVIEHLEDPAAFLRRVASLLTPGGIFVLRTPNIASLERDVFGRFYHSIKRDHLNYFSPRSVVTFMHAGGLHPCFLATESHLLRGFLGPAQAMHERLLRGSDILAAGVAQRQGIA